MIDDGPPVSALFFCAQPIHLANYKCSFLWNLLAKTLLNPDSRFLRATRVQVGPVQWHLAQELANTMVVDTTTFLHLFFFKALLACLPVDLACWLRLRSRRFV